MARTPDISVRLWRSELFIYDDDEGPRSNPTRTSDASTMIEEGGKLKETLKAFFPKDGIELPYHKDPDEPAFNNDTEMLDSDKRATQRLKEALAGIRINPKTIGFGYEEEKWMRYDETKLDSDVHQRQVMIIVELLIHQQVVELIVVDNVNPFENQNQDDCVLRLELPDVMAEKII